MLRLQEKSIRWALLSIKKHQDTYIFPPPFEFLAIEEYADEVVKYLTSLDLLNEGLRDYRTSLSPKSVKGFRISTQLDPLDTICSHAIIYEIADDLERARLPKSENIAHSFRLKPQTDGTMYDEDYTWDSFKKHASTLTEDSDYSYILVTDIADFYPSIYLHDIETALGEAVTYSGKTAHAKTLIKYIQAMHLLQTHKGLPVGPQFARPVAELILDEIDRHLKDLGIKHCRYVDDYYIFCRSEKEAYKNLAELAQFLFDRRGLKLNEKKTEILSKQVFINTYLKNPDDTVNDGIMDNFYDLLDELGIDRDPYREIDPSTISDSDYKRIQESNLESILEHQLEKPEPDSALISFLLMNLARFDNTNIADKLLEDRIIVKIFPKIRNIIFYLDRVRSFSKPQHDSIGKKVLTLISENFIGSIAFVRIWLLYLFTQNNEWDNIEYLEELLKSHKDPLTERELYLALGRAHNLRFFRNNKDKDLDINSWTKRAFIASMSILPKDEREPWYKSRERRSRDFLEVIVEKWARAHPF